MNILLVSAFPEHHPNLKPGQYLQKTGEGLRKALQSLGHSVDEFDYRHIEKQHRKSEKWTHRKKKFCKLFRKTWMPRFLRQMQFRIASIQAMNSELLQTTQNNNYDMVIFTKAEIIAPSTIAAISKMTPTWYFFMDPIKTALSALIHEQAQQATKASATRQSVVDLFLRSNADTVLLTQGADADYFYPSEATENKYDVVFAGKMHPHRQEYINCCKQAGIAITTFGPGADNATASGNELGDIYRKAKVILDLHNSGNNTGFSLRVFEAMATGNLLISEYSKDMAQFFEHGKEVIMINSPEECVEQINYFLRHDAERKAIAQAGAMRISENFTWKAIAETICRSVIT